MGLTIAAGRLSDRLGRKPVAIAMAALAGVSFFLFFNHAPAWAVPPLWVLGFLGFFSGDALIAGFALEIVPTHYRATVGGLRYVHGDRLRRRRAGPGGRLYDRFAGHGPAIQWMLAAIPITHDRHPVPARAGGKNAGGNERCLEAVFAVILLFPARRAPPRK